MTAYSMLHFAMAGFCLFFACVHFSMWMAERADRINRWISVSFLGFGLLDLALASYSRGASHVLWGTPVPWALMGMAAVPASVALAETIWAAFGRPADGWRRTLSRGLLSLSLLRIALSLAQWRFAFPGNWEDFALSFSPAVTLTWATNGAVGILWGVEGVLAIRAGMRLGWLALAGSVLALAVVGHDMALCRSATGNSLLGLAGLPFLFFAFTNVAHDLILSKRAQREGGDVGRYKLIEKLAAGGMGEIYLAARTGPAGFERHVVVKKMLGGAGDSESVERFLSEARLAAQLQHPNIVSVYDMGHLEEGWFLVMEYLPGASLAQIRDRLRQRGEKIPVEVAVFAAEQIARGLQHAHEKGIVHRDVSPQNVMATFSGEIKVVDFGIAKEAAREEEAFAEAVTHETRTVDPGLTAAGQVLGKLPYLAPESVGGSPATPLSDQFALGVILFELLAGERPFDPESALERHADPWARLPAMEECRPDAPSRLARAIERTLARHPAERFPSLREFSAEMRAIAGRLPEIDLPVWLRKYFGDEAARADSPEATRPSPTLPGVETKTAGGGQSPDETASGDEPSRR